MPRVNTGEINTGFYLGLGLIAAVIVAGLIQMAFVKVAHRG